MSGGFVVLLQLAALVLAALYSRELGGLFSVDRFLLLAATLSCALYFSLWAFDSTAAGNTMVDAVEVAHGAMVDVALCRNEQHRMLVEVHRYSTHPDSLRLALEKMLR